VVQVTTEGILDCLSRQAGAGKVDRLQTATVREEFFPCRGNHKFFSRRPFIEVAWEIKTCQVLNAATTQWNKQLPVTDKQRGLIIKVPAYWIIPKGVWSGSCHHFFKFWDPSTTFGTDKAFTHLKYDTQTELDKY